MSEPTNLTFTNGYMIFVQGDKYNWYSARKWQADKFIEVMRFGTMKSMGMPNPREETEPFQKNGFQYRFIILNDWGPCYLENMTTKKQREVKYIELEDSKTHNHFDGEPKKVSTITRGR